MILQPGKCYSFLRVDFERYPAFVRVVEVRREALAATDRYLLWGQVLRVHSDRYVGCSNSITVDCFDQNFVEITSEQFSALWNLYATKTF